MDDIIINSKNENRDTSSTGIYFVWLATVAAVFIALGIKYSDKTGILEGLSFYERYDGLIGGILTHLRAAVMCSVACLMQILSLYILSYSPLLIPASIIIIGYRGFATGVAYGMLSRTDDAVQLIMYTVITAAICIMAAMLIRCRNNSTEGFSVIIKKTAIFTVTAGFSVIGELVLSYII